VCPSDPIAGGPSAEYVNSNSLATWNSNFGDAPGNANVVQHGAEYNYTGYGESYSIAFPWAADVLDYPQPRVVMNNSQPGHWWNASYANTDVPLVSDMAPYDGTGATGVDNSTEGVFYRVTTTLPTANTYGPYIYNSGNHAGDGQNVGFGDDHVTWETSPYVGENGDNIFTYTTATGGVNGTTDTSQVGLIPMFSGIVKIPVIQTEVAPFDTCMTPVRAADPDDATQNNAW
jgi:hypothetical protein